MDSLVPFTFSCHAQSCTSTVSYHAQFHSMLDGLAALSSASASPPTLTRLVLLHRQASVDCIQCAQVLHVTYA